VTDAAKMDVLVTTTTENREELERIKKLGVKIFEA
jgi:hypothetical protein